MIFFSFWHIPPSPLNIWICTVSAAILPENRAALYSGCETPEQNLTITGLLCWSDYHLWINSLGNYKWNFIQSWFDWWQINCPHHFQMSVNNVYTSNQLSSLSCFPPNCLNSIKRRNDCQCDTSSRSYNHYPSYSIMHFCAGFWC